MIGLAGFVMLDSVTRTEEGVAGQLERLKMQERAFVLLAQDLNASFSIDLEQDLTLDSGALTATWKATDAGLTRLLTFPDRPPVSQRLLKEPARLARVGALIQISLPDAAVIRVFALP